MIRANIEESEKRVYIDVSGYISSRDANKFLSDYKNMIRNIKSSQYRLVVSPSSFECENNNDIRTVCMAFLKTGYKKMYLVDPKKELINSMSLGTIEKKLFLKSVKIIQSLDIIN
ncbi:hypothetical protein CHF27_001990 [Romboutsia maritimum]|uniref:STAS domain-containing protein n=1 Tax=Romboutsia maritimum TaxID=2020948 RepID=A0A371IX00_9FIRM|nr:hypothetical protein [Romboutsia maritimum]RDY24995.1 hypothetical protein CHF27_001990 [Romboutsia maritimum]